MKIRCSPFPEILNTERPEQESEGMIWLRNEMRPGEQSTVPLEHSGFVSANLNRGRIQFFPSYKDGRWEINIKGIARYNLQENTTNLDVSMNAEQIKKLEQQLALHIEQAMKAAAARAQQDLKADIFTFHEVFRAKMPKLYHKHKQRWNEEIFPNIKISYDIQARLIDPGKRTLPTGWKPKEVKK